MQEIHNQPMKLRNNKSISPNLQHDEESSVSGSSRKRKSQSISENHQVPRSKHPKKNASIVGVTMRNGKYGVKIHDRIRKKDVWLGTFESVEEAKRVYWAKKEELEKEFKALAEKIKVGEIKKTSEFVGVSRRASGKFAAHIRDPIRRKKLYLGAFDSEEDASEAYLAKKEELEKEAKGKKGVNWCKRGSRRATSLDFKKWRNVGDSGGCYNQGRFDSCNGESGSSDSGISKESSSILEENSDDIDDDDDEDSSLVDNRESSKNCGSGDKENLAMLEEKKSSKNGESGAKENLAMLEENSDDGDDDDSGLVDNQESSKNGGSGAKEYLAMLEEDNGEPCSENQESSIEFGRSRSHSLDGESGPKENLEMLEDSRVEDLPMQKNGAEKELIVVDSNANILLRTKSGAPVMDCNGCLLGEWSWIDDLALSSNW